MPQTFANTYDLFNQMRSGGALPQDMSLPAFARFANDATGTNEFSQGERGGLGGLVSKGSYWVDKGLEKTGVPDWLGQHVSDLFQSVGASPQAGYEVGHGAPRAALDMASFFLPGLGEANAAARLGIASAMMGAHTYADTGSPTETGISMAMPFVMPVGGNMVAGAAEKVGLINPVSKVLGATLDKTDKATVDLVTQKFLEDRPSQLAYFAAHQLGAAGTQLATEYAHDAIQNRTWAPWDQQTLYDKVLSTAAGNFPYMLGGVPDLISGKPMPYGRPETIPGIRQQEAVTGPEVPTSAVSQDQARNSLIRQKASADFAEALKAPGENRAVLMAQARNRMAENMYMAEKLPEYDEFTKRLPTVDEFNKQFGYTGQEVKGIVDLAQHAQANPEIPADLMNAWAAVPRLTVDQVRDGAKITQVHNDTQAIADTTGVKPHVDETSTVVNALLNAGTPPDEAVVAAKVGERNNLQDRVEKLSRSEQMAAERERQRQIASYENEGGAIPFGARQTPKSGADILKEMAPKPEKPAETKTANEKMQEGKNKSYAEKVQKNQNEFAEVAQAAADTSKPLHADPEIDKALRGSVKVVTDELSKNPNSASVYSQWGNWRDQLLNPEKRRAGSWGSPEKPRPFGDVLSGFLGYRSSRERQKENAKSVIKPVEKSKDPDNALAGSALDDKLYQIQGHYDLTDETMAKLRDEVTKSSDPMGTIRDFILNKVNGEKRRGEKEASRDPGDDTTDKEGEAEFEGFRGEQAQGDPTITSSNDLFETLLRKQGFSEPEIKVWSNWLNQIKNLFNIPGLQMGELINDSAKWTAAGLAQKDMQRIFLAKALYGGDDGGRQLGVTLAHEIGHIVRNMAQRGELPGRFNDSINGLDAFITANPAAAQEFLKMLHEQLPAGYRDLPLWKEALQNTNPSELMSNIMSAWALNKIDGDNGTAFALMSAPEAKGWLQSMSEYARRIMGGLKGLFWADPQADRAKLMTAGLKSITDTFDGLTRALKEADNRMNDLQQMATIGSQDVWVMRTSEMNQGYEAQSFGQGTLRHEIEMPYTDTKETGKVEGIWNAFIRDLNYIGNMIPGFRKATSLLMDHGPEMASNANQYMAPIVAEANTMTGDVSARGKAYQSWRRLNADVDLKTNRVASQIVQWLQQEKIGDQAFVSDGQGGITNKVEQFLKQSNPVWPPGATNGYKLGDAFQALKPQARKDIMDWIAKSAESNKVLNGAVSDSLLEQRRGQMKMFLGLKQPEKFTQSDAIVRQFTDAVDKSLSQDQATKWQGAKEMEVARDKIGDDDHYQHMLDMWMVAKQDSQSILNTYKPWFQSMIRRGKYLVTATNKDGQRYSDVIGNLQGDYEEWKRNVRAAGYTNVLTPEETQQMRFRISPGDDMLQTLRLIEDRNRENMNLLLADAPQDVRDIANNGNSVLADVARIMNAGDISTTAGFKGLTGEGGRRVTPGSMDMIETQRMAFNVVARLNATRRMSSHLAFELMNPELRRFPAELRQVKQSLDAYMTPNTDLNRYVQRMNSVMYLGGNLPSHLMYFMQNWMTPVAEAVSRGYSPVKATVEITRAVKDVGKFALGLMKTKLGLDKDHLALESIRDPEERKLFAWASQKGFRSVGNVMSQFGAGSSYGAADINRITQGSPNRKWYDVVTKPLNVMADTTMKAFSAVHHFNQDVSLLTGFRQAREAMGGNYDREAAFNQAKDFMRSAVFNGGRANRPIMESKMGALGGMAYSLQHWTLGWLNNLMRYTAQWRGPEYLDLSPQQRTNARRAALTMLGTQFAAAGALGMPFVQAGLTILEKLTGKSITGNIYATLQKQLDDDSKDGGGFANVIMNGAANAMLANAGLPVDMGSRMAVGGVLGISPSDGFSGDAVFGPTAQIVSNVVAGLKSASQGDFATAANQLSPSAVKKSISLWRNGGQIATGGGEIVPSSGVEKAAYALGFQPQALSNLQQYSNYKKQLDSSLQIQHKQEAQTILAALQDDPEDARRLLVETAQRTNRTPQEIGQEVSKTAADHAFPKDIREGLGPESGSEAMAMAQGLGVHLPQAQEQAKGTYMDNILQMLGLRPIRPNAYAAQRDTIEGYDPFSKYSRPKY